MITIQDQFSAEFGRKRIALIGAVQPHTQYAAFLFRFDATLGHGMSGCERPGERDAP